MTTAIDSVDGQKAASKTGAEEKKSKKVKVKQADPDASDDEGEGGAGEGIQFFCRRPNPSSVIPSQPIPLAFLHRIVREHRAKLRAAEIVAKEGAAAKEAAETARTEVARARADQQAASAGGRNGEPMGRSATATSGLSVLSSTTASSGAVDIPTSSHASASDSAASSLLSNGTALPSLGGSPSMGSETGSKEPTEEQQPPAEPEEVEEPPWFSSLANMPDLRSAGIPLVPPPTSSKTGSRPAAGGDRRDDHNSSKVKGKGKATLLELLESDEAFTGKKGLNGASVPATPTQAHAHLQSEAASPVTASPPPPAPPAPPPPEIFDELLVPPDNFTMVNSFVYRSSFPKKKHFPFLRTLGLRSVLTLILEEYPEQNTKFLDENGITFFQYGIPGNKEPFVQIPHDKITAALCTILDRRNHPMLIHCNKGKHRTGCLVGCLRKLQSWSLTAVFDEYRRFSFPKSRSMDQEFVELYRANEVWEQVDTRWLPHWAVLPNVNTTTRPKQLLAPRPEEGLLAEEEEAEVVDRGM